MTLTIVQAPAEILLQKARQFEKSDLALLTHEFMQRLMQLGHDARGYAVAFPQVSLSLRAFTFCPSMTRMDERLFVNPRWTAVTRRNELTDVEDDEGCLSVGHGKSYVKVKRRHRIRAEATEVLRWWDTKRPRKLMMFNCELSGIEARIWQHECDHLDGVLLGGAKLSAEGLPVVHDSDNPDCSCEKCVMDDVNQAEV